MKTSRISAFLLAVTVAAGCGRSESSSSDPAQTHTVRDDDSYNQKTGARSCYSAADETVKQRGCEDLWYFTRPVRLPEDRGILNEDDGEYWFCPNVSNVASLTLEQVAALLCNFAEDNGYPEHVSIRAICGPKPTDFGSYCFGADTSFV